MRMIKKLGPIGVLAAMMLFTSYAAAIPVGGTLLDTRTETFGIGVDVVCNVYHYSSTSEFVYTYQITNNSSPAPISFFSVAMSNPSVDVSLATYDSGIGWIDPSYWEIVTPPLQSVNAAFTDSIAVGQTSSLLYFTSDTAPDTVAGALFGTAPGGIPTYSTGYLLAPVPEPATFALISLGAAVILKRRRSI